jgi:hypothetical protein
MEKQFFSNCFGYLEVNIDKINIIEAFEKDISLALNLEYIGNNLPYDSQNGRHSNIRCSNFTSDEIYKIFYNKNILNNIKCLTDDFIILSSIESFYLSQSKIHKDFCGELKIFKLLFYLDDVSNINKGPLYVIPGTQNVYDKYSLSISSNVMWPPGYKNNDGSDYRKYKEYLENNAPKKYICSNQDKVIIFNTALLHGSEGNKIQPTLLRRAIGMTIICIDRNNKQLMEKVNEFLINFNVDTKKQSLSYLYCQNNCSEWLNHFYTPNNIELSNFIGSEDGTDTAALIRAKEKNLFANYINALEKNDDEITNETKYNCFKNQITNYTI